MDFHGAVLVYMLAPIIGAVCASILMNKFQALS
jgi:glycerol uptake facilitator-like aquaporin